MPAFISTCRKPRQATRTIAKLLALLLHSEYENRGKRSVGDVMARASERGFSRVAFMHERHGALSSIEFFDAKDGWLPEILDVRRVKISESRLRVPADLTLDAAGAEGKAYAGLFQLKDSDVEGLDKSACVVASLSAGKAEFFSRGEPRLQLEVALRTAKPSP